MPSRSRPAERETANARLRADAPRFPDPPINALRPVVRTLDIKEIPKCKVGVRQATRSLGLTPRMHGKRIQSLPPVVERPKELRQAIDLIVVVGSENWNSLISLSISRYQSPPITDSVWPQLSISVIVTG